ncbi:hypothetical protein F8M41_023231 [Gigaspora margarita]|uniref:Uncharacterized protein n=1 Tax=Gigaspora margarita TaxID=4874 RepID=A0A8H4EHA2_GIGMA|nr:hypothetical protein F8M41_023231 [Gigaspora margarita]
MDQETTPELSLSQEPSQVPQAQYHYQGQSLQDQALQAKTDHQQDKISQMKPDHHHKRVVEHHENEQILVPTINKE